MRVFMLLGLVAAALPGLAAEPAWENIEYTAGGDESQLLDVYAPEGGGPFPVVIMVHGGGWTGGSKNGTITTLVEPLTQAGFVCVSINYRLAPQHAWPACLDDVLAAVRWVKTHADDYKGDPTRVALMGYSAGGHLASFAGTVVDDSARVQAVVGLAALTDFVQELPKRGNILGRAQRGLLNRPMELTAESLGMLRAISPVNHLRAGLPSVLLIHGDADGSVPYEQSLIYQARLRALGVPCELITVPGGTHRLAQWSTCLPDIDVRLIDWLRATLQASANVPLAPLYDTPNP